MKKYIIFAVAALAASVACTKTSIDYDQVPETSISFQVAKYMAQTRADLGTGTSLWGEWTNPTFKTFAFYYPGSGTGNQLFMDNMLISPLKSDNSAAEDEAGTAKWAPEVERFWPKTGYINFFSYASKNALADDAVTIADVHDGETLTENKTISFGTADAPLTIVADDNILLADACYNATQSNAGSDVNNISGPGETTPQGVPTLFRHLLTKVQFEVKLASSKAHASTDYEVSLLAWITDDSSGLTPTCGIVNNGYLTVTSTAKAGDNLQIKDWNTSGNQVWYDATTKAWESQIQMTSVPADAPLKLAHDATASETFTLLAPRAFRPQVIDEAKAKLRFYITVKAFQTGQTTPYSAETFTVYKQLKDVTPNSGTWRCNDFVKYMIIIDPVTTAVTFDPAVVPWTEQPQDVKIPDAATDR